jgi:cell division protein FtsN
LYSKVPLSPVDDKKSPPLESSNIENSNPKANKSSEEVMQDIINHGIASNTEQVQKKKKKELPEYIDEFGERKIGKPTENAISVNNRNPEEQAKKPKPEVNPNTETDPIKSLLGDSTNKPKEDKKVIKTKAEKNGVFYVQVGSFKSDDQADRQKATLLMQGLHSNVVEAEREGSTVYRVRMGPFYSKKETDEIEKKLSHEAIPYKVIKTED